MVERVRKFRRLRFWDVSPCLGPFAASRGCHLHLRVVVACKLQAARPNESLLLLRFVRAVYLGAQMGPNDRYNVSFFDPFLPCTHYSRAITLDKLFTNPFPTL